MAIYNIKRNELSKISTILDQHDFVDRISKSSKYIKEEFQDFGVRLAHKLKDPRHKSLYIKLARELPRGILEQALTFTLDYPTRDQNKGRLYMWKLTELCNKHKIKIPSGARKKRLSTKKKTNPQLSFID